MVVWVQKDFVRVFTPHPHHDGRVDWGPGLPSIYKGVSYCMLLASEEIKIKIGSVVSTEYVSLLHHCKVKKKKVSQTTVSRGLPVI